jgi:hypothetical protein
MTGIGLFLSVWAPQLAANLVEELYNKVELSHVTRTRSDMPGEMIDSGVATLAVPALKQSLVGIC